jgi:predicted ATPase/class 3 adenylate cyclase
VHKNLNPSHLVVNQRTGDLRVIGFAIASLLEGEEPSRVGAEHLEGTLAYLSPEQTGRTSRAVDWRTDLYALGATFHEMLTGRPPFGTDDPLRLVHAHIAMTPVPVHEIDASVPPMLSRLVAKLLAKAPEERYQSARGLAADLERCRREWRERHRIDEFEPGQADVSDRLRPPQALYGRETERAALRRAFSEVRDGATTLVVVRGQGGIGKSALVEDLRRSVSEGAGYFVEGKCDQIQRQSPFGSISLAVQDLVRQLLTESDTDLAAWRARLDEAVGANARVLVDVVPDLALIVGSLPPAPELTATAARNRFHLTFQQFVRVFASPARPLVLFLDDLQWGDAASIELIRVLLGDLETRGLLLVGAYRDREVGPSHPVSLLLDALGAERTPYATLDVGPLDAAAITVLVGDTIGRAGAPVADLAATLTEKTAGNPFFIGELLKTLRDGGCLAFDRGAGTWTWDLERVQAFPVTDNVVDLMAEKLARLPAPTRRAVQHAACIGGEFDLGVLALASEATPEDTATRLWEALAAGLVRPVGSEYRRALGAGPAVLGALPAAEAGRIRFRFQHDRVQQAAYDSIPAAERPHVHLRIGRLLRDARQAHDERGFAAVDHLNRAAALLAAGDERWQVALLDRDAAVQAKAATAFGSALAYAEAGLALCDAERWETDRDTCRRLVLDAAECAYLTGDYPRMAAHCDTARAHATSALERTEIEEVEIKAHMARNELREAIERARSALAVLGVKLPAHPKRAHVLPLLARAMALIGRRTTADLARLPEMQDPTQLAIMRILTTVAQPAYYTAPDLLPVILLRMVIVTMRHGNSPLAPYAWMAYAHIINLVFGDARAALGYGEFSRRLLERYGALEQACRIEFMFHTFVRHWTAHWRDTLPGLLDAYRLGLQTGDLEYGATAIHLYCYHLLYVEPDLAVVDAEMARYNAAIVAMKQRRSEDNARLRHQVVANLRGQAREPWRLVGEHFDEERALPLLQEVRDETGLSQIHLYRAVLSYLFGRRDDAVSCIRKATAHAEGLNGLVLRPIFHFYRALILTDAGRPGMAARADLRALRRWAALAPMNHAHRVHLVEAERAARRGRDVPAMRSYDAAIAAAREHGHLGDEALAAERAARFHLAAGRTRIARGYALDARHAYARWGAAAKVAWLDATHASLLGAAPAAEPAAGAPALEIATVMKSAQALAGEIDLARLLDRLLRLAMENAGAQRGALVLERDGELRIEAHGSVDDDTLAVLESIPVEPADGTPARIPAAVVNFVARTREPVVLDDAQRSRRFSRDPYLATGPARSILCAPLVTRQKLAGIVYLENERTTGAFQASRLEMLRLLSAQAAIALENARLYAAQVELAAAQERFVPREFLRSLNRASIVDVGLGDNIRKEMTVLFSDVRGFTSLVERMSPAEHIGFLNAYLSFMEPAILDHGGFIDSYIGDAVMALFDVGPDRAVQAGIAMSAALRRFNAERAGAGLPATAMGIGVNTGVLTLGTIGGPMRIKCSAIGDCVNVASRVESLTKRYGVAMLVSNHTRDRLADPERYALRWVDRVRVVGKEEPVTLYEVLAADPAETADAKRAASHVYEEALHAYQRRDFAAAERGFEECLVRVPADGVARHHAARSARFLAGGVPPGWDGVDTLDRK